MLILSPYPGHRDRKADAELVAGSLRNDQRMSEMVKRRHPKVRPAGADVSALCTITGQEVLARERIIARHLADAA
jgi:hypothetical protein